MANSKIKKSVEDLEKEITCAICFEHYTDPKVLPCSHYYCKQCIQSLIGVSKSFSCPECRKITTLPKGSVDNLPTAVSINRMKAIHSSIEQEQAPVQSSIDQEQNTECEMCSEGKAEAYCQECTMSICPECVKQHQKMKVFAGHKIASTKTCEMCSEDKTEGFCQQCKMYICAECVKQHQKMKVFAGHTIMIQVGLNCVSPSRLNISTKEELKPRQRGAIPVSPSRQRAAIQSELKAIGHKKSIPQVATTLPSQQKLSTQEELKLFSSAGHKSIPERVKAISPANRMKNSATLVKRGKPAIYQLPLNYVLKNNRDGLFKCEVGTFYPTTTKPEKILMVLGATGAGKSTLINGIVNYLFEVKWNDDFRFQIISDGSNQSCSQTKNITAYRLCSAVLPYTLTVIDTPGFGDTSGIENDKRIAAQIKHFFSDTRYVDTLHGIGFVTQASLARLTPTQRYIFDAVLSIFGKDISENIFLLATFADGQTPPVLQATKAANIPYQESFRFNNSALYASNDPTDPFSSMFWQMGYSSFEKFFYRFSRAEPKSLALTKEVLKERNQLEIFIPGLQEQVRIGLSQLDVLQQEERVLKQHEAELNANRNFTYTIDVTRFRKKDLPAGIHTTTCMECNFTCHDNCKLPNDEDKADCWAMDEDGCCRICPNNCIWNLHSNVPYIFQYYTATETRTSDDLKRQYFSAKSSKESAEAMIAENEEKLNTMQVEVYMLIEQARKSIKRLEEIALKPNPLTELEYLDLLIESEKLEARPGHEKRIAQYMKLRMNAEILKNVVPKVSTNEQKSKTFFQKLGEGVGSLFS